MEFANLVCKHLKSNAIALVKDRQLIGKGCGQTSRIDSLRQAIVKAVEGSRSARPPVGAEPVRRDRADPEPEGTRPAVVIEAAQIPGQDEQDLLRQVVGVGLGRVVLEQPAADQWGVERRQVSPRRLVVRQTPQPIEQAEGRIVHAAHSAQGS